MQPVSPYRLGEPLGQCQVGSVWSAVDEQGRPLTVAVLDTAARDQGWRDAFAATVSALAEPGPDRPQYVRADVRAEVPWAAYAGPVGAGAGAERVFESLGQRVIANETTAATATSATNATSVTTTMPAVPPVSPAPVPQQKQQQPSWNSSAAVFPASGGAAGVGGTAGGGFGESGNGSGGFGGGGVYQTSSPPGPISGTPASGAGADPYPVDQYGLGYSPSAEPNPFSSPQRRIEPSPPRKSRTGLWLGLAGALVVLLAVGGTIFALTRAGGGDDPNKPTATTAAPQAVGTVPTAAPASPGAEPPKPVNSWPAKFPAYTPWDKVTTLRLEGVAFPVKLPAGWQCTLAARAEGYIKYNCGTPSGAPEQIGGELVVRSCAQPCSEQQQTQLRKNEEAWGAQWIRTGPYSTLAETVLDVDGQQRHAMTVIGYYRGGESGELDSQLVLRMTAPVKQSAQLRKLASFFHSELVF